MVVALLAPATAAAQTPTVQPGDWIDQGGCTLGWVFDGSDGAVYFSTAAHCVDNGSDEIKIADQAGATPTPTPGSTLGTVALRGTDGPDASLDVALIRVREEMAPMVAGAMRGHPEIPTGVISPLEAEPGDLVQLSGWGLVLYANPNTREKRQGVFTDGGKWTYDALMPVINGDSGSAVAHVPTGAALGLNKGYHCIDSATGCAGYGPSIAAIERLAATGGLTLRLRVAGAPRPSQPPAAGQPQPKPPAAPQPQPPAAQDQTPRTAPATTALVKAGKLSARKVAKSKRFQVTVSPSRPLSNVSVLLVRAKKTFALGTASALRSRAVVKMKPRSKLRAGRYQLILNGTDDLGRAVRATASVKVSK
jgi:hypothetical protein